MPEELSQKEIDDLISSIDSPKKIEDKTIGLCQGCNKISKKVLIRASGETEIIIIDEHDSIIYTGKVHSGKTVICLSCSNKEEYLVP